MKLSTLLDVARAEIGVTEYPANSNNVKYNTWYYGQEVKDGLWDTTFPWCMAFVQWCWSQAKWALPYKTASCSGLLNWYKTNQPSRVFDNPQAGDIMILNGHTGLVESVDGGYVVTIEGNTSPSDSGSQYNGGCVARKKRAISSVVAFIRPVTFDAEMEAAAEKQQTAEVVAENATTESNANSNDKSNEEVVEMTGEEIYKKLNEYLGTLDVPEWAKENADYQFALASGITDGTNPMCMIPRYQAAIMAARAVFVSTGKQTTLTDELKGAGEE